MPRGGRRPNAGRKPDPATLEFRAFWRTWFESEEGRRHLIKRAKHSDAVLGKLIDKCFPSFQALKLEAEKPQTIVLRMGNLKPAYAPRMPIIIKTDPPKE